MYTSGLQNPQIFRESEAMPWDSYLLRRFEVSDRRLETLEECEAYLGNPPTLWALLTVFVVQVSQAL